MKNGGWIMTHVALPSAEKTASFVLTLFLFLLCEAAVAFAPIWTVRTFAYDSSIYFHSVGIFFLEPKFSTWLPVWFLVHIFFLPGAHTRANHLPARYFFSCGCVPVIYSPRDWVPVQNPVMYARC